MSLEQNLQEWAESKGFTYSGNSNNPKLIIFGEEHFKNGLIEAQFELIRFLKPEYVLHEFQEGVYDGKSLYQKNSVIEDKTSKKYKELRTFQVRSHFLGFQLVGVDLSPDQAFLTPHNSIEDFHIRRENEMARIMVEYAKKSIKPVVAIIGAYHSHQASPIHEILASEEIPYCVIQQMKIERSSGTNSRLQNMLN